MENPSAAKGVVYIRSAEGRSFIFRSKVSASGRLTIPAFGRSTVSEARGTVSAEGRSTEII